MKRREWLIGLGWVPLVATWGFCTSSRAYQAAFWDGHDIREFSEVTMIPAESIRCLRARTDQAGFERFVEKMQLSTMGPKENLFGWGFCDLHVDWWLDGPHAEVFGVSDEPGQFLEAAAFKDGHLYYVNVSW